MANNRTTTAIATPDLEEVFSANVNANAACLTPSKLFTEEQLTSLNQRSNSKGAIQLLGHLLIMGVSGYWWLSHLDVLWLALPALPIYGFSFASMFAAMHECVHRTAFANNRVNDYVGWFAGLLSFYNSTFYRRYHKWHHRYTQIPGKDPELEDVKPASLPQYFWQISAIPWWIGKLKGHFRLAIGRMENCPYIPQTARAEVMRSVQLQLFAYAVAIALSLYFQQPWFWYGWLLPMIVGQPLLRMILLSEHTGCTNDANPSTNTRTTYTLSLIQFLMWNMPFHAEHHFCPSIPFHALEKAHQYLKSHLQHVEQGYIAANQSFIRQFPQSSTQRSTQQSAQP